MIGSGAAASGFARRGTPATGMRAPTPGGPVQVNLAYNPYRRRPGPVYYDFPLAQGGPLVWVFPQAALPPPEQAGNVSPDACPATFAPPRSNVFIKQLTLTFSIGPEF